MPHQPRPIRQSADAAERIRRPRETIEAPTLTALSATLASRIRAGVHTGEVELGGGDERDSRFTSEAEDTVRHGYAAFIAGDMELLGSLYTPDVVQRQPGHNQTSGEYKGVDDVIAFYGRLFELSGGTLQLELKSLKTSGDKVVSVHGIKAQHATASRSTRTRASSSRSRARRFPAST